MKRYAIKEIFATLQGEGAQTGAPAVFLRFAGCNLGYEVCPWCDTDWEKAELRLPADATRTRIDEAARARFGRGGNGLLVVVTGGEPSLQLDADLSTALHDAGYRIAMESNGSRRVNRRLVDWLTVSPKQDAFVQKCGDELKIVFTGSSAPGIAGSVEAVRRIARDTDFDHYFLQPVDLPEDGSANLDETIRAVMELGPPWRLSMQTHKIAGLP